MNANTLKTATNTCRSKKKTKKICEILQSDKIPQAMESNHYLGVFEMRATEITPNKEMKRKKFTQEVKTYPADCRKIAAVDFNKHDWD